jgi:hypothetical protein
LFFPLRMPFYRPIGSEEVCLNLGALGGTSWGTISRKWGYMTSPGLPCSSFDWWVCITSGSGTHERVHPSPVRATRKHRIPQPESRPARSELPLGSSLGTRFGSCCFTAATQISPVMATTSSFTLNGGRQRTDARCRPPGRLRVHDRSGLNDVGNLGIFDSPNA